jgi:putative transcriptional regulator
MMQTIISGEHKEGALAGHLLVATPAIQESCFARSVIYLCAHNKEGAMGIIINQPVANLELREIFDQLDIEFDASIRSLPIHFGGPVEAHRGFVLHTADKAGLDSIIGQDGIAMSASLTVLQQLAGGHGPSQGMLVLGYAGWSPGQLESEIEGGSWLVVPATKKLVFDTGNDTKWNVAVSSLGFDMAHFSTTVGHA